MDATRYSSLITVRIKRCLPPGFLPYLSLKTPQAVVYQLLVIPVSWSLNPSALGVCIQNHAESLEISRAVILL